MTKNHFCQCGKKLSSYHSLWRHKKICKKEQEPKSDSKTVGDILNNVVQRVDMDKPIMKKTYLPKKAMIPAQAALKPTMEKTHSPKNTMDEVPIQAVEALKPRSLSDLAADIEIESDSEDSSEDETEEEEIDYEVMPDNPRELKEAFRNLYKQFRRDIDMFNKLVLMLDELKRMECLTQEECNAMNKHLQNKLENRN